MFVRLFLSLILFLFSFTCIAQEYTLKGVVNDETKQPVAFSNVTLQAVSEITSIKGTTSDDHGFFKFEGLKADDYILKVSFLGFETYTDTLSVQGNINYKPIVLKEKAENLEHVTVIAKRPTIKRMVDRLVFNVENSTLSNGNVFDVLKHTPGVLVLNDAITTSNGTPTIYINDRKVHLSSKEVVQLLEGTSANTIKSIEVIDSPPAKYEAEGGSVINIITSKNIIAGYNGSVFGTYKQGSKYPKYALGTNHFFKTDKIDAFLSYNISPRKDFRHNNEFVNFIENNQVTSSWETDFKRTRETATQNINANIDYELNANNSIGFSSNILVSPREHTKTFVNSLTEVFDSSHVLDSMFNTSNRLVDETYNLAFTLDYIHRFKKEGETLSANAHHTNYDFSSYQNVDTDYFLPNDSNAFRNNRFQTFSSQKIKLYTGQIDYVLPITDSESFETGGKLSNINSESILRQYIFENNQKIEDLQNSDTFLYDEMNYAGYASYSKDWKMWSFKSGLRVEYTDITGNSLSSSQVNTSKYVKFFPSFHVMHAFNEHHELYFNYNKRIYRPRYSELNPFKYYFNDYAFLTGNPGLKPEIDDVFTLGYTLNNKYTFEIYYRYENNPTRQITFQDNENNILKFTNTNVDRNISYGLDFTTYTKLNSFWSLYVFSSFFYYEGEFYAQESNNLLVSNDKWSFISQIVNYFSFLKDKSLTAEVSYLYISPIVEGSSTISNRQGLDINFRKTLWNNKASLSLGVSDIFNTLNFSQTNKYLNQDLFLKSRLENRLVTFGFNYKFGNTHLKTNQKSIELDERDRLNIKN